MKSEPQRTLRISQRNAQVSSSAPSAKTSANSAVKSYRYYSVVGRLIFLLIITGCVIALAQAQTRQRKRSTRPAPTQARTAIKYSAFQHSSDKHKSLACNACHKIPTTWNAKRDFPDVADFPDHDACVRCHRQQFFTRQAVIGTGPTICTVCHVRAAPREDV